MDYPALIREIMESEDTVGADKIHTESFSLVYIAEGCSRAAYVIDDIVVKFPTSDVGTIESMFEFEIAGLNNEHGEYFLLPLLYYEFGYLVQPLCAPVGYSRHFKTIFDWAICCGFDKTYIDKLYNDIIIFVKRHNLVPDEVYKPDSWGLYQMKLVLLDFGLTTSAYKKYYVETESL